MSKPGIEGLFRGMFTMRIASPSVVVVSLIVALGCSEGPQIVPVSGRVTLDGEPLAGAQVNTQPIGGTENLNPGSGSFGTTGNDGRYTLEVVEPAQPGAVVGEHSVTVTLDAHRADPSSDLVQARTRPDWPRKFTDGSLRITVPEGGTDSADIDLKIQQR